MKPQINKKFFKHIKDKRQKKAIKSLAYGRITHHAVAQFLHHAQYATNTKNAIIFSFLVPPNFFTKKERKHLKFLHVIAQEQYLQQVHKIAISDPRSAANIRAIAEIRGLIQQNTAPQQGKRPKLIVNLTERQQKQEVKQEQEQEQKQLNKQTIKRQKLILVQNGS